MILKKFLILLLFIFLLPFKTFALEQKDKYFNLVFPDSFHDDLISQKFGGSSDILDITDSISKLNNNYRNVSIILIYNSNNFYRLNILLHPKDSVNSFSLYGVISGSNLVINQYLTFSKQSQRWQISPNNGDVSFLESNAYTQIKNCIELGNCPTSKPSESTYTGTITFASGTSSVSSNYPVISNFDNNLDYDIVYHNLLYFTNSKYLLVDNTNDSNVIRSIKYNDMAISEYDNFPSYLEYVNKPDEPVNPDEPLDTNVGVWKNWVYWFVDNNSEYGVLVNIYIFLFISVIFCSILYLLNLLKKMRW